MELLLFNESHQITYFGKCTILADGRNGELKVTPTEEDFKVCPYIFKQHVIKLNDPFENQTLNAFDIHSAEFQQRSFLPILENIQTNEIHSNRLKEFICIFLKSLGKYKREQFLDLIKENSEELYSNILVKGGFKKVRKDNSLPETIENNGNEQPGLEMVEIGRKLRKRKRNEANIEAENAENGSSEEDYQSGESDIYDSDFYEDIYEELENESDAVENCRHPKKPKHNSVNEIIKAPNFKLISYDEIGTLRKKLFIFPVEDKTMCYVYGWSTRKNQYVCWRCYHINGKGLKYCHVSAMVCQNEKKEDYVKLFQTKHLCEMNKFNPDDYVFDASKQIIHEPNFKIFNYEELGKLRSKLVIFPSNNQELCYEYFRRGSNNYFICGRCRNKRHVFAKIGKNDSTNENYVRLSRKEHICKMIRFHPENYNFNEAERIVKAPNFKVDSYMQNGVSKKKLFIFTSIKNKLGYEYFFCNKFQNFFCCGCIQSKVQVTAKICHDMDGNNYLKLNKAKHICQIRNYGVQYGVNYNIFYKPDFEIIEKIIYGKTLKKLYIINQENRNLCYEFTYFQKLKTFVCNRCHSQNSHNFKAYHCYDEDGKEFIRVQDRPHLCQPLPYPINDCEEDKTIRPPNYKFMKRKCNGKLVEKLVIFANEEKTLCYEYTKKTKDAWECSLCKNRFKKTVSAAHIHKSNQEEYIECGKNEHQCESIKFDPEDAQLNIVRKPHFMLEKGIIYRQKKSSKRLTIFNKNDPTLCYYFTCINGRNYYQCSKCATKKVFVGANHIYQNDDKAEEEYVVLTDTPHICKMEKYTPLISNLRIIKPPNFYLEKVKTCNGENERLMVKDWKNDNNLWYSYLRNGTKGVYKCNKCVKKGKAVTSTLHTSGNGEDYAELSLIEHVCEPVRHERNQ